MKITPEQLKAVCWALSGTTLCMAGDNHFAFYVGPRAYVTDSDAGAAIFCDLLKRAVRAKDEVVWVESTSFQKDAYVKIRVCDPLETIKTDLAPTELEAWVLAVTELAGRTGK